MSKQPSLQELYDLHSNMVYNLSLNYLQNASDAEEVTQDVFVKVHQKIDSFKGNSTIKTWIYRITVNKCLDFIKAKKRKKRFGFHIPIIWGQDDNVVAGASDFNHPGVLMEDKEALERVFGKINELPHNQKTAILLKSVEGMSQKEIAAVLEISVKAVESLLSRGKVSLKKKLG